MMHPRASLPILALIGAIALSPPASAAPTESPPSEPAPAPAPAPEAPAPAPPAAPVAPMPPPAAPAAATPRPKCRSIRLGTAREVQNILQDLTEEGFARIEPIGNLICGW